jgi:hypothetical protein
LELLPGAKEVPEEDQVEFQVNHRVLKYDVASNNLVGHGS